MSNQQNGEPAPVEVDDVAWLADYCRKPIDPGGEHLPVLRRVIAALQSSRSGHASEVCERIAMKHQKEESAYAAGKKAGALECAEALRSGQDGGDAGVAPVLYASPEQLEGAIAGTLQGFGALHPEAGGYLPVRTTPAGKFTAPLYTSPQPAAVPAWAQDAEIEYRYTSGTHWCPLGPAERMRENFDGIYRLKAGRFPVEPAAVPASQAVIGFLSPEDMQSLCHSGVSVSLSPSRLLETDVSVYAALAANKEAP